MAIGKKASATPGRGEALATGAALRLAQAIEFVPRGQRQGDREVRGVGLIRERDLDPVVRRSSVEVVGFIQHEVSGRERPKNSHASSGPRDVDLGRGRPQAGEDVDSAGLGGAVVVLITVHSGGVAGFSGRPDHHRVARHCYRPEVVKRPGVGSFQVGLLRDQGGDLSVGITGSVSQQSGDNGYGDEFDTFPGFIR